MRLFPAATSTVVALLALPGLASAATFDTPRTVRGESSRVVQLPAVTVGAGGRAALAYSEQLKRRGPLGIVARRGTLTDPVGRRDILATSGFGPVVTMTARRTFVAWSHFVARGGTTVRVRSAGHGRRFSRVRTLSTARAVSGSVRLARLGADRAVVAWLENVSGRRAVHYAITRRDGTFTASRELTPEVGPLSQVGLGTAPDGSVTAVWGTPISITPLRNQQLASARIDPRTLAVTRAPRVDAVRSQDGAEIIPGPAATGPGGSALTWTEQGAFPQLLRAQFGAGAPETVFALTDSTDLGERYAQGPAIALPATRAPRAAWAVIDAVAGEGAFDTAGRVFVADRRADGTFPSPVAVSAPDRIARNPLAAATRHHAITAWLEGRYPEFRLRYHADAATSAPARALAPRVRTDVALAASDRGALVAWTVPRRNGTRSDAELGAALRVAVLRDR